jgi:hypothetical protein
LTPTITYPPRIVISGNETLLQIAVENAYNTLGNAVKGAILLQSFHEAGQSITLTWNGNTVTFTCVADYTGAIGTYPLRTTETSLEWSQKVLRAFMSHYLLMNDFIITGTVVMSLWYRINFEPYIKQAYNNLTITKTASCDTTDSDYTPDDLFENFKLRLQLLSESSGVLYKYRSPVFIPFLFSGLNASLNYDLKRLLYTDLTGHFTFPETATLQHLHSILPKIYLHLSFLGDNITAESLAPEEYLYALPGKMSQTKEKALNTQSTSIYADLVSSKRFLSLAPIIKATDIYTPEKLYFIFTAAVPNATIIITERFRQHTAETRTLATFSAAAYSLYELSIGFQSVKQADYGSKIPTEYDISIENGSGALISERRTFQIDYTYLRTARYFLFKNSYGVYEVFRATGDAEKANKIRKEWFERVIHAQNDTDQSRKSLDIQHTYTMKINTGYLPAPLNFYIASEFLGSSDVYWLKNNRAYAVQIEENEVSVSKSDIENLHEFDFQVTLNDMDDTFFQEFLPGSELPIQGDFSSDFNNDLNV